MDPKTFVTQVQLSGMPITHERPQNIRQAIEKHVKDESGRLLEVYPLLGGRGDDLIVVCSFPSDGAALKAWLGLGSRFGWKTQTNPSPSFEEFQEIYESIQSTPVGATFPVARESAGR